MVAIKYSKEMKRSKKYRVFFNGEEADVLQSDVGSFAGVISDCDVTVEIECLCDFDGKTVFISPVAKKITHVTENGRIKFCHPPGEDLVVFLNENHSTDNPLMLFSNLPEEKPSEEDENVLFFKSGKIHETGELHLKDNQTVYIEEGAVVRGVIRAEGKKGIKVSGRGVLDVTYHIADKGKNRHPVLLDSCRDFELRDFIIMNSRVWIVVLGDCENGLLQQTRLTGKYGATDGCDICGSSDIVLDRVFVSNNDDAVVIKAFGDKEVYALHRNHWNKPVKNILVKDCIFMNTGGNGIEIGHELRTDSVSGVTFKNIDILHVHGMGCALSIHNCDRALIENIVFDDIRIEHCYNKFVDIRVMKSRYSLDTERGGIKNILLKNIDLTYNEFNTGYTISSVSGYDVHHQAENIVFEDLKLNGKVVMQPEEIELTFRDVENLIFRNTYTGEETVLEHSRS